MSIVVVGFGIGLDVSRHLLMLSTCDSSVWFTLGSGLERGAEFSTRMLGNGVYTAAVIFIAQILWRSTSAHHRDTVLLRTRYEVG